MWILPALSAVTTFLNCLFNQPLVDLFTAVIAIAHSASKEAAAVVAISAATDLARCTTWTLPVLAVEPL